MEKEINLLDNLTIYIQDYNLQSILIQISIILVSTLFIDYIQRRAINRVTSKLDIDKKIKHIWIDSFFNSLKVPLSLMIYIVSLTLSLTVVNSVLEVEILEKIDNFRNILIIYLIGLFFYKFIKKIKNHLLSSIEKGNYSGDKTFIQIFGNIASTTVIIIFSLLILQQLGVSVSGLLAFGGMGGLIVGLSAKELLSNVFGGLTIMLDKPFKVGDWIRSPDKSIEGVVEEIGIRRTCIRTFDKRPLYVPNSLFNTISIENPSRMTNRRIYETIGIRYADIDKMNTITKRVKQLLLNHTAIDTNQTLMVNFNSFNSSSVDFFIYTFTKTTDWVKYHGIKHNILLEISNIITEEGAEIAFPTHTIHLSKEEVVE